MTKRLIAADSAAKIALLKAYYGNDTDGVLCRWPMFTTTFPRNPDTTTTNKPFHFDPLPGTEALTTALSTNHDQEIILAFDADAKGEVMRWQIGCFAAQLGIEPQAIQHLNPTGFSRHEIDCALQGITPPDTPLGQAEYSKLLFDEYLDRHLKRLLGTNRGPGNLLLRHHSLTILFLLIEHKGQSMAPRTQRWQLQGDIEGINLGVPASLANGLFPDRNKALSLAGKLENRPFEVDRVTRSPLELAAPTAYRLPELIQDASVRLGLNPTQAIDIIIKLYHGIVLHGQTMGLITSSSPGTPPPAPQTVTGLREQVAKRYGASSLEKHANLHSGMIVPLLPHLDGPTLSQTLSQDEASLYDLILTRAIASQMRPAVGESIVIDFLVDSKYEFQSHCHELTDPGFLRALPEQRGTWQGPGSITGIEKGQQFQASLRCQPIPIEGQGLEPYTFESLFADLADFSIIADPATISLIGDLTTLGYLTISEQGFLAATDQAAQVVTILGRAFPRMPGLNLAAYIEQTIQEAITGRKDLPFALKQFDQTLMLHGKILAKTKIPPKVPSVRPRASSTIIKQTSPHPDSNETKAPEPSPPLLEEQLPDDEPTIETSAAAPKIQDGQNIGEEIEQTTADDPLSNGWLVDDESEPKSAPDPFAPPDDLLKLFADSVSGRAAETDAIGQQPAPLDSAAHPPDQPQRPSFSRTDKECPACGQAMSIKEDHFGTCWQCSGFPTCRYSESIQELLCPLCGHTLCQRQTSTGKQFFTCEASDCQFMSWSTPHYLPCGLCDSPYLVEKTVQGKFQLRCPKAGCSYAQPFPDRPTLSEPPPPTSASPKKVMVRRVVPGSAPAATGTKKVRIVRRRS